MVRDVEKVDPINFYAGFYDQIIKLTGQFMGYAQFINQAPEATENYPLSSKHHHIILLQIFKILQGLTSIKSAIEAAMPNLCKTDPTQYRQSRLIQGEVDPWY